MLAVQWHLLAPSNVSANLWPGHSTQAVFMANNIWCNINLHFHILGIGRMADKTMTVHIFIIDSNNIL